MEVFDTISTVLTHKSHDLWSIEPDATVFSAIELMAEKHIGALLVMTGNSLVGIVSERDYMKKVMLKGKSSKTSQVREIMTKKVISVSPHVL